jgi:hypothetical protein
MGIVNTSARARPIQWCKGEELEMSSEEVFGASKNGFSMYGKFFKVVAKEIGMRAQLRTIGYCAPFT